MLWPETEPIKLPRSVAPKYTDVSQVIEGPLQTCNIWGANINDLDICGRIKSNLLKMFFFFDLYLDYIYADNR